MIDNSGLFALMVERAEELYFSALQQYRENRASGRFHKAGVALCNAREFAKYLRSAKKNLSREQARIARLTSDCRTCPECLSGAA